MSNAHNIHRAAMAAKRSTFAAQDALSLAWSDHADRRPGALRAAVLRKVERRLQRVRSELEQLDNELHPAIFGE